MKYKPTYLRQFSAPGIYWRKTNIP